MFYILSETLIACRGRTAQIFFKVETLLNDAFKLVRSVLYNLQHHKTFNLNCVFFFLYTVYDAMLQTLSK